MGFLVQHVHPREDIRKMKLTHVDSRFCSHFRGDEFPSPKGPGGHRMKNVAPPCLGYHVKLKKIRPPKRAEKIFDDNILIPSKGFRLNPKGW